MKNSINSRISTIIFVLGSILLGILILYLPITNLLNKSLIEKWQLSAQAKIYSLQLTLQQGIEGGNSLTSRSAIRDKICDYTDGKISWEELRAFSQEKYVDGASVLDNIVFAYRSIEDRMLVYYLSPEQEHIFDEFQKLSFPLNQNQILQLGEKTYFLVVSDITKDQETIGKDILLFNISPTLDNLSSDAFSIELLPITTNSSNTQSQTDRKVVCYEETLLSVEERVRISTNLSNILGNADINTSQYLVFYIFLIILLFVISYRIFIHQTHEVITEIEDSKQDFMQLAYQDALTSAYTRQYFMAWQKKIANELSSKNGSYILVMIDIDKLKNINDTYGHETGDIVLRTVVHTIQENLRKDDIVVRFGGDEFIVLFKDIPLKTAYQIMERIEKELKQIDVESIEITLSYGITKIDDIKAINDAIKQADRKMYQVKNYKIE